jgi:tetratricopeptide (TPR) repeat protein
MRIQHMHVIWKKGALVIMAAGVLACGGGHGERYVARGKVFYEQGRYAEAALNYRKALQINPDFGEAYYGLGLAEAKLGHAGETLGAVSRAVELMPDNEDVKAFAGELYLMRYQADRDAPAYEQINNIADELLRRNARSFAALRLKGYLAIADGKPGEALDLLRRANEIRPLVPDVAATLTGTLLLERRDAEAVALGNSLIAAHPDTGAIYDTLYGHYINNGDLAEAERILLLKIKNNPTDAFPVGQLAEHYWRHKERAKAEETISGLLRDPQAFPQAHLLIGGFYEGMGEPDEAVRIFDEGARTHPKEKTAYQQRALAALVAGGKRNEALERIGKLLAAGEAADELKGMRAKLLLHSPVGAERRQAVSDLEELVRKAPDQTAWHLELGRAYTAGRQLREARREFETVVRREPGNTQAWLALGAVAALARDFEECRKDTAEALRRDPSLAGARLLHARALAGLGQYEQARGEYDQLIDAHPGYRQARLEHALVAVVEGHYAAAEKEFRTNYDPAHGDFRALEGMLAVDFAAGQTGKGWALVEAEHAAHPESLALVKIRAAAAVRAGQWQAAISEYERLRASQPEDTGILAALASAYQHTGDFVRATPLLERVQTAHPEDWRTAFLLGYAYQMTGKATEAEQAYRQSLRLKPDQAEVLNNLSFLLAEERSDAAGLDEAAALAQKAMRATGGNVASTDTLGWIYLKQNRVESARQIYATLAARNPQNAIVHYHFGLVLRRKGDRTASERELEAALRNGLPGAEQKAARELLAEVKIQEPGTRTLPF